MILATRLGEFALGAPASAKSAQAGLRLSLFDWAVCAIAGAAEPVAGVVRSLAGGEGGNAVASVVGSPQKLPPRAAAWVNGATSHALDYDDTHFAHIGHPSVAVVPAALAVAEATGADAPAFRDAALIGAEASIRVGIWLGRDHYQAGFHQTATAGAFGAACAAGRLLNLSPDQMGHALGVVSTRASGLKSQFGTMGKPLNAGIAAANGVEAALLAAKGFVSDARAVDGPQGFGPTHHGANKVEAFERLGSDWRFETVSHKFHACCHGLHAMLESIASIDPLPNPDLITAVRTAAHPCWRNVCNIAAPKTGLEAKFSFRLAAAMALSGVSTTAVASFSDVTATDPRLCALRDRIDADFSDRLAETEAGVEVSLADGRVLRGRHDLLDPLDTGVRTRRLREKARALVGNDRADALWIASGADDLAPLTSILTEPV